MRKPRKPTGDYEVGYGKPPKAGQFQKGRSGNPRGRPKKELDIKAILAGLTEQKVSVILNGRKVQISSLQAMLHKNYSKALQGDPRAFERFLKLLEQFGIAMPKEDVEVAPLDENEDAIIEAFLRKQHSEDDAA